MLPVSYCRPGHPDLLMLRELQAAHRQALQQLAQHGQVLWRYLGIAPQELTIVEVRHDYRSSCR